MFLELDPSAPVATPETPDAGQQPAAPPVAAAAPESPPVAAPARVRGPDGRFSKADAKAEFLDKSRRIMDAIVAAPAIAPSPDENALDEDEEIDDDAVVEEQPAAGQSPPTDPAATSGEGPSQDLVTVAKALGVPDYVIGMAKSDDALHMAIAMSNPGLADDGDDLSPQPQAPQPQREPKQDAPSLVPDDYRVKFMLPEDYADPDDPMVAQQRHLVDTIADLQELVAHMASDVVASRKQQADNSERAVQQKFDAVLDASEWDLVGKVAEFKGPQDTAVRVRGLLFEEYLKVRKALPSLSEERAAEIVYEQVLKKKPAAKKSPNEAARIAALRKSSERILGSGNGGPPTPEKPRSETKEQQFLRRVAEIKARVQ